jgi:hypothetical protein
MVFLKANDPFGKDVELEISLSGDDKGTWLEITAEDEAGAVVDSWQCDDFNELRPFIRQLREICDAFYALDTQTYSLPEEPADRPQPKFGAMLVELDGFSNSGPGREPHGKGH